MSTHPQLALAAADLVQLCREGSDEHQIVERLHAHAAAGHQPGLILVAVAALAASLVESLPGGPALFEAISAHYAVEEALHETGDAGGAQ